VTTESPGYKKIPWHSQGLWCQVCWTLLN
jgi:hypothetical protein